MHTFSLTWVDCLANGAEVTLHEKEITYNGWTGSGYTVIDSETGAGAYKITGGANGAVYIVTGLVILALATIPIQFLLLSLGLGPFAFLVGSISFIATVLLAYVYTDDINVPILAFARFVAVVGLYVAIPVPAALLLAPHLALALATLGLIFALARALFHASRIRDDYTMGINDEV